MLNCYERNGLVFWDEREIKLRRDMSDFFTCTLAYYLRETNRAFEFIQVEAPLLTPRALVNPNYTEDDIYIVHDDLALRPETTMGSYAVARHYLEHHTGVRLPMVVWQVGKSFRREQDQPTKFMRLKEFYQQEFQILYATNTKMDYASVVVPAVNSMLKPWIGACHIEDSDRLPDYAAWTKDVVCDKNGMEVCSISERKDFPNARCLEVAIGLDRCVYNWYKKDEVKDDEGDAKA